MVARRTWGLVALGAACAVALGAAVLRHPRRDEASVGTADNPVVVLLGARHAARLGPADLAELARTVGERSGLVVELRVEADPVAAIDAFGGPADAGLLSLFEFLLASSEHQVEPRLQLLRAGQATGYTGEILVQARSPIQAVRDLAGRRVAFVDPHSTSGFVFPMQLLALAHIDVEPVFAGSHEQALAKLASGEVAAAATYEDPARVDPALRVIARTQPIPNEPVFFRRGLDPAKRDRLVAALVELPATPAGRRLLPTIAGAVGFGPASAATYAEARRAIAAARKTLYDLVPGGWAIERRRTTDVVP